MLVACSASSTPAPAPAASATWRVPAGWKSETIAFPLDFAPSLGHRGAEELRFAPGFFDPGAPGYWSYTFVWRLDDPTTLTGEQLADELVVYFRGLAQAVDPALAVDVIRVDANPGAASRFDVHAIVVDAFKTKQPLAVAGWAKRTPCERGALWTFVLAPERSALRPQLDALAAEATCAQQAR